MVVNKDYLYSDITDKIIKSAIKVHKTLGPGLVEKLYQRALKIELTNIGLLLNFAKMKLEIKRVIV